MILRYLILCLLLVPQLEAQNNPEWTANHQPFRIVGNLYYVGSNDLASYLIATPEGLILINSNLQSSVPQIRHNVEALGFHFNDVKILLISHAHRDHDAGSASIKQLTGAKYEVMDADVPVVESGGKADFFYGGRSLSYTPAKVDRTLHDGDEVKLGGSILTAHLTPGHTKGCTTWTMRITEASRTYNVVIIGSTGINPGYKLLGDPKYPQMSADYARTFRTLKSLPCDIFLGAHGSYFALNEKFAQIRQGSANPFVDPQGYASFVEDHEQAYRRELAKQTATKH
ncbi:subclass B3 metallo-beta-lactamase [Granulicella arctica]|uniref:subclass B3 metallo-beta-lactamase n=1 Tax=Granulicella arctica TaxID=940613 RepID=UPI0021E0CC02|nr:subclass B3 metallo-beta-lactamase [Granulicella arctica]